MWRLSISGALVCQTLKYAYYDALVLLWIHYFNFHVQIKRTKILQLWGLDWKWIIDILILYGFVFGLIIWFQKGQESISNNTTKANTIISIIRQKV